MPVIFMPSNIGPDSLRYYDWQENRVGRTLYEQKKVILQEVGYYSLTCQVVDKAGTFEVTLTPVSEYYLKGTCTCSIYRRNEAGCRHLVAAALAGADHYHTVVFKDWKYQLELSLTQVPPMTSRAVRKASSRGKPVILMTTLELTFYESTKGFYSPYVHFVFKPWFVSDLPAELMERFEQGVDGAELAHQYLHTTSRWKDSLTKYSTTANVQPINIAPEVWDIMAQYIALALERNYYYSNLVEFNTSKTLLYMLKHRIPLFRWDKEKNTVTHPITLHPDEVMLGFVLEDTPKGYRVTLGVDLEGKTYHLGETCFVLEEKTPRLLLAGTMLAPLLNRHVLPMARVLPLQIPRIPEALTTFRERYFAELVKRAPISGNALHWEEVRAVPVPRLYLSQKGDAPIEAELRFGYDKYELPAHPNAPAEELRLSDEILGGVKIIRDLEKEATYAAIVGEATYGLKRAGAERPGVYTLRARTHPLDFFLKHIPALAAQGFEIYGEESILKVNRARPTFSLTISSGIDWFDVKAVVKYGDQEVKFSEIRRALKRGERYVKLADGSVGQIPEEWLERYKHLLGLSEETEEGLRVRDTQLFLLDELLAEADTKAIAEEFNARRDRLRAFERIEPQPLPCGFNGELRPYQKAGYDWLHFLHQYGFGGILADDMGLGKTVQTLVFLLSLKQRGALSRPALLVVPKSLLVNWQRESARFTPDLRFLEFTGMTRKKDTSLFDDYDVVITTYGTMLRDIEFLREYRFSYAILDESQAIKNPLAKSSKAARLLQSDHRLCLTGTPVQNNAYELWSQFAFLNPGLLGSLDYFKSEFVNVIEKRDEAAQAALEVLRRLTYPFVLRRTKEMVAQELPPLTERIIFTDLEPAQRKLYQDVREYYRAQLLGLIEEDQDINDVRFKILEGLLRMRQVCIHPKLVDPSYHGESAKFEALLDTLETLREEGHKALVFSQFVQTLSLLRKEMDARGMVYAYLDGQTENRQAQVDRFQNDPQVPFFLISLKAGGLGLNLTAADYVIHIDPWWNPAVEMQATDRAHRIGQDKPVFVYKFIARETVEEKMLLLQERKRELVEQLVAADESSFKSLTKEDVQLLFS